MMKTIFRLLLFLPLIAIAGTVTPTWTFTDFGLDALSVKKMRVTPLAPYGTNGSGIITGDWRERTTDTNGSVTLTNIANGYSYLVTFSGPFVKTSFTNSFSGSVTGAVSAVDYISSTLISDNGLVAYSKTAADARFALRSNMVVVGSEPTLNGTNFATLYGGGGSGTTYTFANTNAALSFYTNGSTVLLGTNVTATGGDISATSSNNIVAQIATKLSTNTIGATINAITFGLVADGVTDNTVALSNLLNTAGNVLIPSGNYAVSNPVVVNSTVRIIGADGARILYSGSTNTFALTLNGAGSVLRGVGFTGQNGTNFAANSAGGAVSINATALSEISRCDFQSFNGKSIFFEGTGDLYSRSNWTDISYNTFRNVFDCIYGGANEKTEFTQIAFNRGTIFGGDGIKISDPNVRVIGNGFNGYISPEGSGVNSSPLTSTGFRMVVSNSVNRGHSVVLGNGFAHNLYDVWIQGVKGGNNSGTFDFANNVIGGGGYAVVTNCVLIQLSGGLFGPTTGISIVNCTNVSLANITMQSPWTLTGTTGLTIGAGVSSNGVYLAQNGSFTGNGSGLTNVNAATATLATTATTATNSLQLGGNAAANYITNNQGGVTLRANILDQVGATIISLGKGDIFWRGSANTLVDQDDPDNANDYPRLLYSDGTEMATNGMLFGSGASLTNLNATNLYGTVPSNSLPAYATTNFVASSIATSNAVLATTNYVQSAEWVGFTATSTNLNYANGALQTFTVTSATNFIFTDPTGASTNSTITFRLNLIGSNTITWPATLLNAGALTVTNNRSAFLFDWVPEGTNWYGYKLR